MNAPHTTGIAHEYERLPIDSIVPSTTQAQARRRARFDPKAMAELVESIVQVGVMQPIVVVKIGGEGGKALDAMGRPHYELVAGERRWQAAQQAGLATIPAVISNIERAEIVQFQVIENKQRESLHPLDEADAFKEIMDTQGLRAEEVAERIGLSRSHVYNRLKLLDVAPAVQQALETGSIHHSAALRIARIPGKKLQEKALKIATKPNWRGDKPSDRELGEALQNDFMVRLDGVVFDLADARLNPQRGACTGCPHNSLNDPELQAEVVSQHGANAHVCTDKPCHDAKAIEHFALRKEEILGKGGRVIEGDEAKRLKPQRWQNIDGFIALDEKADDDDQSVGGRTYREILAGALTGPKAPAITLFLDPYDKKAKELIDEKAGAKLLKKAGVDYIEAAPRGDDEAPEAAESPEQTESRRRKEAEELAKQEERRKLELGTRQQVLKLIFAKWKGPLKKPELVAIADRLYQEGPMVESVDALYEGDPATAKMNEQALLKFIVICLVGPAAEYPRDNAGHLYDLAKRLKIDAAKVRKEVKAALAGEPTPKPKGKGGKK